MGGELLPLFLIYYIYYGDDVQVQPSIKKAG